MTANRRLPPPASEMDAAPKGQLLHWYILAGQEPLGLDFSRARLAGMNLSGVRLRQVNLQGADLRGVRLRWANLARCDLRLADLERADLQGATLCGADVHGARLAGADLRGASLYGLRGVPADVRGARLSAGTYARSEWTPAELLRWWEAGACVEDTCDLPPIARAALAEARELPPILARLAG